MIKSSFATRFYEIQLAIVKKKSKIEKIGISKKILNILI